LFFAFASLNLPGGRLYAKMSLPNPRSIQELPVESSSSDALLHKHYSMYRMEKQEVAVFQSAELNQKRQLSRRPVIELPVSDPRRRPAHT